MRKNAFSLWHCDMSAQLNNVFEENMWCEMWRKWAPVYKNSTHRASLFIILYDSIYVCIVYRTLSLHVLKRKTVYLISL